MRDSVEFDVPTKATLQISLANGDTLPATEENLKKFGLIDTGILANRVYDQFSGLLEDNGLYTDEYYDYDNAELYPVYSLFVACFEDPQYLDTEAMRVVRAKVANLERRLRGEDPETLPSVADPAEFFDN